MISTSQPVRVLLQDQPVLGEILFDFGVRFHLHQDDTLTQLMERYRIEEDVFMARVELASESRLLDMSYLAQLPTHLLLAYLDYNHRQFIKHRLPYFAELIQAAGTSHPDYKVVIEDLKMAFPLFREDFIRHVYKEEDELFAFVRQMLVFLEDPRRYGSMLKRLSTSSLHRMALHHAEDDDDMAGIRSLTKEYFLDPEAPLTLVLLYDGLQKFEKELAHHAQVENELLFPKALELEYKVNGFIHRHSVLN